MNRPDLLQLRVERLNKTSQERQTLALEMIADELLLICRQLEIMAAKTGAPNANDGDGPADPIEEPAQEAGGLVRGYIEIFSVGPYRYTKLEDAVAQMQRLRTVTEKEIQHLIDRKLG